MAINNGGLIITKKEKSFKKFFDETREDVEKEISRKIKNPDIMYTLQGGKRLRSVLSLLIFKTCCNGNANQKDYRRALEGTVSIELAHAASLIHDDIIDCDKERRGETALHVKNGINTALLTGHKMIAMGFDIALSHGIEMGKLYVDTWNTALSGELMEINSNGKNNGNDRGKKKDGLSSQSLFKRYKEIIDLKTASLFDSACRFGALEAKAPAKLTKILGKYGREIGLAYQLADDLVDLNMGERIDSVITSLIEALRIKYKKEEKLYALLSKENWLKKIPKIKKLYVGEIQKHLKKADNIASSLVIPNNAYKPLIKEAPRYIINQMLKDMNMVI